jgi:hypothetical protein
MPAVRSRNSVLRIGVNCNADPDPDFYLKVNANLMRSVRIRIQVRLLSHNKFKYCMKNIGT